MQTLEGAKILVVEDEHKLRKMLEMILADEGFDVVPAANGQEAWEVLESATVGLVLTDVMMDTLDGVELTRRIRADSRFREIPVVLLTAKVLPEDRYKGFEAGASDYIVKPFDPVELVYRVKARLHPVSQPGVRPLPSREGSGAIRLDEAGSAARLGAAVIPLTQTEVSILAYLMRNPGRIITYEELLCDVLGYSSGTGAPEVVRTHISNIRQKLAREAPDSQLIVTIARQGYMFRGEPAGGPGQ